MNEAQKQQYKDKYYQAKQKGVKFWPDIIYKDLLVSFALFLLLVGLATFVGVAGEPKADPSDSSYVPRPEWYFLFLFKFLAIYGQIPGLGKIEWLATAVIPGLAVGALFLVPFLDRSPYRHFSKRGPALAFMTVLVATMVGLTLIADVPTTVLGPLQFIAGLALPALGMLAAFLIPLIIKKGTNQALAWMTGISSVLILGLSVVVMALAPAPAATEEAALATTLPEQILAGQDLYSVQCVECHGAEGEGGEIQGVSEQLDGKVLPPIHSNDVMYPFSDETLGQIIAYGQPDQGMNPFGKAYGGELSVSEIEQIVAFMRYTWDDRAELPAEVASANALPTLGPGETPSYEQHIAPLVKRYCASCHRAGKKNNNYLMGSYEEMLTSGDNAPSLVAGDLNSLLIRMVVNREEIPDIGSAMPPTKALKPELMEIFTRWVLAGMPQTQAEADALQAPPAAEPTAPITTTVPITP
jgi:mono/diheme cytochrome c family protein